MQIRERIVWDRCSSVGRDGCRKSVGDETNHAADVVDSAEHILLDRHVGADEGTRKGAVRVERWLLRQRHDFVDVQVLLANTRFARKENDGHVDDDGVG